MRFLKVFFLLAACTLPLTTAAAVTIAPTVEIREPVAIPYATTPLELATERLPARYAGHDAEEIYALLAQSDAGAAPTRPLVGNLDARDSLFAFTVDTTGSGDERLSASYDRQGGKLEIRYVMAANQVTEGWNWYEHNDPQVADYYLYKFLPFRDVTVRKPGEDIWKYEYMVTFSNLYDFYPRSFDDEAGFVAQIALPPQEAERLLQRGAIGMLALCRLQPPFHAQSGTFWKATQSAPYDYTLKKRYVFTALRELWFYDFQRGHVLAKLRPLPK